MIFTELRQQQAAGGRGRKNVPLSVSLDENTWVVEGERYQEISF